MKTVLWRFKNSNNKLTAAFIWEDSSYLSNEDSMTIPANDFLEVKTEIISKKGNHVMVLLYIERLEPNDWCIQYWCLQWELRNVIFEIDRSKDR